MNETTDPKAGLKQALSQLENVHKVLSEVTAQGQKVKELAAALSCIEGFHAQVKAQLDALDPPPAPTPIAEAAPEQAVS